MPRCVHRWPILFFALVASAHAAITIQSPQEYQVFQRQSKESGTIAIRGESSDACDEVLVSEGLNRLTMPAEGTCSFHGGLNVAATGWHQIEIRLIHNKKPVGSVRIAHVGVGEVFVISGQSNSTNYGEVPQHPHSGMVSTFDGKTWRLADDPQPGVQDNSKLGSFIPGFGDALSEKLHVPIGVACTGSGGTSVRQWLPKGDRFSVPPTSARGFTQISEHEWESDGKLFAGLTARIRELGPAGFRMLLWHQGESDAHQPAGHDIPAAEYRRLMERLISSVRVATFDFPWMVAQVSYHVPSDPATPELRAAQASLWKDGLALEGPDTDTLTGANRQNGGTGVHMSEQGLRLHGAMWAEKVIQWISRN